MRVQDSSEISTANLDPPHRRHGWAAVDGAFQPFLVLTTFGENQVLWSAIDAGAAGFGAQDSSAEDLISAVGAVAGGGAWFDPGVAPRVLDRYSRVVAPATRDAARLHLLTIASTMCCA